MLAPQFFGRRKTGRAAADNDDFLGNLAGASGARLRCRSFAFLAHEYLIIALFHRPAGERIEGGRAQGLACAQIEARVMPGTPDGILDHKTVGERPAVMRACRPDGEDLGPTAHQQHLLVAAMADKLSAIGKIDKRDALDQIRSFRLFGLQPFSSPLAIRFITPLRPGSRTRFWSACSNSASPAPRLSAHQYLTSACAVRRGSIQAEASRPFEYQANEFNRRIAAIFLIPRALFDRITRSLALSYSSPRERIRAPDP